MLNYILLSNFIGRSNINQLLYDLLISFLLSNTRKPLLGVCGTRKLLPMMAFFLGATRRLINDRLLPLLNIPTTWDKMLPCKVNIFIWCLKLDILPHRLNPSSRCIKIPDISYPSCNGNVESNQHIFFECDITKNLRRLLGCGVITLSLYLFPSTIGETS